VSAPGLVTAHLDRIHVARRGRGAA